MTTRSTAHAHNDNCIASVPIFKSLTEEEMLEVAEITHARKLSRGEVVYRLGDLVNKLFVLHKGTVRISRINSSGKEQVIRVVGPGEFIGELSLFSDVPSTDNAVVTSPVTMCVIDGHDLKTIMARHTSIAFKIMDVLSRRLEQAETLIETISLDSVEKRLAHALLGLADEDGLVTLQMKRGDFASQLGMSQETLSRKLGAFEDNELITQVSSRRIQLRDRERIENLVL